MAAFVELILGERENPCTPEDAVAASRVAGRGEKAIVGTDEHPELGLCGDCAAGGADPGVHNCEHDPGWQVLNRPGQRQGSRPHVAGRDAMSDVDDPGLGG